MKTVDLNGKWAVRAESLDCHGIENLEKALSARGGWIEARVPGEIHLDLIRAGQMPEPTVGTNMPSCRWPETKSWWYRRRFKIAAGFLKHERQQLVFDGLDLYAQVFLNGSMVGEVKNAFVPAIFDVRQFLRVGANELVVRLTSGHELALAAEGRTPDMVKGDLSLTASASVPNPVREADPYGHRMWEGRRWLRKPQFSYGWDWVDALPNIGIWRAVRLEGRSHAVLHDLRLDTVREGNRVALEMEAIIENLHFGSERVGALALTIAPPDGGKEIRRRYEASLPPSRVSIKDVIAVPHPRLWWPNGMGEQPLYRVLAEMMDPDGEACDRHEFAIGLRTVEIDRKPLREGSRFCFRVNGEEVFCRGGNIGPHDAILARISPAKYEALVAEARDANMTMLRINGCSIYEDEVFYDACDRAGILVWQDFMLTCGTYPEEDEAFCNAIRDEAEAIVPTLRHRPSIAVWCGNNECQWLSGEKVDVGGRRFYSQMLPDICRQLDPRRPYVAGSPCGGEDPNSELEGDCHWWHPFFMSPDRGRRIRPEVFDECRSRFVSEYGAIGPCHSDSMREYLAPEEMFPESHAWKMHTNQCEQGILGEAIRRHYIDPEGPSVDESSLYGQLFQAMAHGQAMEALRFRKQDPVNDCQGALIWSYSDCWGETGWSILDYYLRRKASYYAVRRACAPVKVIVRRRGDKFVTRLINDTLHSVRATVDVGWWRLDGMRQDVKSRTVTVPPNRMLQVHAGKSAAAGARNPNEWLYAAVLRGKNCEAEDQSICLLVPCRELAVSAPTIKCRRIGKGMLEVSSPVFAHAVRTEDHGREVVSDNWFDLLPGVPVRLRLAPGRGKVLPVWHPIVSGETK